MKLQDLKVGSTYKWKNTPDVMQYLGEQDSWHQFDLESAPTVVWCEVLDDHLHMVTEVSDA